MAQIAAIISDFGGVLTTPLAAAFEAFAGSSGISLEELGEGMAALTERDGVNPLFRLETGQLGEADFLDALATELTRARGAPVGLGGFGERYFAGLSPNESMIDFMRSLRQRGYRLALCTNNVREWEPLWRSMLPVEEIFEIVVDSAVVGARKPDPEIYRITLGRLGLPARATLLVDDVQVNCDAARELGMQAVWFRDAEQAIAETEAALREAA
jgi:putative hydrolase of the HAD superfamily